MITVQLHHLSNCQNKSERSDASAFILVLSSWLHLPPPFTTCKLKADPRRPAKWPDDVDVPVCHAVILSLDSRPETFHPLFQSHESNV